MVGPTNYDFNPAEFREVYDRFAGPLFRYVYRFTANNEAAEEIVHDIFIQLLKGKFKTQDQATLKSWLYTLAKNMSLNHRKKSSFETSQNEIVARAVADFDLAEQTLTKNLKQKLALVELPEDLKETWALKQRGLDHKQIADQLNIPVGTVKSRFFRLIQVLRQEFKNEL